jgi:vacuolar-type H+-ATPase subunit H
MIKIIYLLKVLATFLTSYVRNSINAKQDATLVAIHTSEAKRRKAIEIADNDRDHLIQIAYETNRRAKKVANVNAVNAKAKSLNVARKLDKKLRALEAV